MKPKKLKSITACLFVFILASWSLRSNAQWSLTGNAATNPSTNFIGTTDAKNLKIRTNNSIRMNITSNGKIGIGNFTPVFKLDVKGGSINTDSLYRIGGKAVLRANLENTWVGFSSGDSNTTGNGNTAIGAGSLKLNTSGSANTAVGGGALTNNNTGSQNIAIGYLSLLLNTSGGNNTACGTNTMLHNTTGFANTATGHQSLINNTEGNSNTGTGVLALASNTSGSENTANGVSAAYSNTEGSSNVAIGTNALYSNQTQSDLVAVGASALYNSTGGYNVAVGSNAMYATSSGYWNAALGYQSMQNNTTGHENTALGFQSMQQNQTGFYNTGVGVYALTTNATGSYNSAFGAGANVASAALNNATAIGSWSSVGCSNCLVLGSSGVNVGIGVNAPSSRLSVSADGTELGGTIVSNTFRTNAGNLGSAAGSNLNLGNFGFKSTNNSSLGIRTYRYSAGSDWSTAAILVSYDVDNSYNAGNSTNYIAFSGTGNIGIGTPYPGYLLDVNGAAAKPGGGSWIVSSDARLKQNVQPYNDGLASLLKINPVTYHYNEKSGYDTKPAYVGVLAQELLDVAPYMVSTFKNKDKEQFYSVDNSAMTYMLINAIKELNAKVQQLENSLSQCCASSENNNLKNETNDAFADDKPFLAQNQPNPFSKQSVIRYYIPGFITAAKIIVTDISGQPLKSFEINKPGFGEITIQANELAAGGYFYSLIIDGIKTESKRMELVK